jgi:predicted HD phosphohydrolase
MNAVDRVAELFLLHGHRLHASGPDGSVTALAHALQCAQLAEWAHAAPALVAAAFLHDVGHFVAHEPASSPFDDLHEIRAVGLLSEEFGSAVVEPIRLHVQAKRFLLATEPGYSQHLSAGSKRSLLRQGGPMAQEEAEVFVALPGSAEAVQLRRWDDLAREPGKRTPPLAYYLDMLAELHARQGDPVQRIGIGALDLA